MKKFWTVLLIVCCCAAGTLSAAEKAPKGWTEKYPAALKRAEKEKKPMLLLFTGSDWCGWCKKLKKEVLDTKEFRELESKIILVYLDFPAQKKQDADIKEQNAGLSRQFQISGYPATVIVSPDGKVLTRISGFRPAPEYVKTIEAVLEK